MDIALSTTQVTWLAVAGLLWDMAGAFFLAKALIFVRDFDLRRRSGTYFDLSIPLLRSLCEQRRDARYGLSLLAAGFSLQLGSAAGVRVSASVCAAALLPLPVIWHHYRYNAGRAVLLATLRVNSINSGIEVWRETFKDVPEKTFADTLKELPTRQRPS